MEFKEFVLYSEVRQHALDRLDRIYKAARNSPEIIPNPDSLYNDIKNRVFKAEKIYNDGFSYAVQVYRFPYIVGERRAFALDDMMNIRNEPSNGNLVVAIIRPPQGGAGSSQVVTIMFRRSDDLGRLSQPFVPGAMDTDRVIRLDKFNSDLMSSSQPIYRPGQPVRAASQPVYQPVAFRRG